MTHTVTNIVIPNDSCHPYERKISSVNYLMNRVQTYPITKEAKENELNIIQDTLHNNEYNKNVSTRHSDQHKHNKNIDRQHQKTISISSTVSHAKLMFCKTY
jgi:hypothetical protein